VLGTRLEMKSNVTVFHFGRTEVHCHVFEISGGGRLLLADMHVIRNRLAIQDALRSSDLT
jgi:hypothetical protein